MQSTIHQLDSNKTETKHQKKWAFNSTNEKLKQKKSVKMVRVIDEGGSRPLRCVNLPPLYPPLPPSSRNWFDSYHFLFFTYKKKKEKFCWCCALPPPEMFCRCVVMDRAGYHALRSRSWNIGKNWGKGSNINLFFSLKKSHQKERKKALKKIPSIRLETKSGRILPLT